MLFRSEDKSIVNRYKETRHAHPLARQGHSLAKAVEVERLALVPVRLRATHVINTTALTHAKLRGEVLRLFGDGTSAAEAMSISVTSFGFKYGIPIEADLVFDVRFLPNPYYIPELKECSGLDEPVQTFLSGYSQTQDFVMHLKDMLNFLLPQYISEGKAALVIAVGCTGGRHRSVAITRAVTEFIRQQGYHASENHRDMTRG